MRPNPLVLKTVILATLPSCLKPLVESQNRVQILASPGISCVTLDKSLASLGAGEEFPHRLVVRLKEVASEGLSGRSHVQRGGQISMSYRL